MLAPIPSIAGSNPPRPFAGGKVTVPKEVGHVAQTKKARIYSEVNIARLRQAIIAQESGGRYQAVNRDSGAVGIGQILPGNVPGWTRQALGRPLTPAQFRANRAAQLRTIEHQLATIAQHQRRAGIEDPDLVIRRVAATWYSGQASLHTSRRPQYCKGKRYPSIASYSDQVLARYYRLKKDENA